jgi:hypothetical protein
MIHAHSENSRCDARCSTATFTVSAPCLVACSTRSCTWLALKIPTASPLSPAVEGWAEIDRDDNGSVADEYGDSVDDDESDIDSAENDDDSDTDTILTDTILVTDDDIDAAFWRDQDLDPDDITDVYDCSLE